VIILNWILKIQGVRIWNGFIWLRIGSSGKLVNTATNLQVPQKAPNFVTR
jgi:hypothetical protein